MKCPVDGIELLMTTRSGVEIDYCPTCRGIWLDRGELDKLIERAEAEMDSRRPAAAAPPPPRLTERPREPAPRGYDDDDYEERRETVYVDQYGKPKKKRSMFGEMFDIFD
jgi:Zn-finger nucleic acid-binding protein